ncbi:MAG: hypothetical protein N2036_12350 [Bryobacteraceae bacterium]|nr:hypothetical protein [Bryobacteraceae bacterium]
MILRVFLAAAAMAAVAWAQPFEAGVVGGFAVQRGLKVESGSISGTVGFKQAPVAGAWGGEAGRRWGGEVRYLYRWGDARVEIGNDRASLTARQHIITGDLLLFLKGGREAPVRPFVVFGGGVRRVEGTGRQQAFHPGSQYAALAQTSETMPVGDFGFGVRVRAGRRGVFRVELRDYLSPKTDNVIAAAPGSKLKGLMHDIVVMAGAGIQF